MGHPEFKQKPNNLDVGQSMAEQLAGVRGKVKAPPAEKPAEDMTLEELLGEEEPRDVPVPEPAPVEPPAPVVETPPAPKPPEPGGSEPRREVEPLDEVKIVGETLDREIERVRGSAVSLPDGDEKRRQLEKQLEYLGVYQKVKSGDRNPLWLEIVRGVFRNLNRIENPQPARQKREPQAPVKRQALTESRPGSKPEASAEAREQRLQVLAEEVKQDRISGRITWDWVDNTLLRQQNYLEPGTPEAGAFMEKWDLEEAERRLAKEEARVRQASPKPLTPDGPTPATVPARQDVVPLSNFEALPAGETTEERESATRAAAWYTLDRLQNFDEINHSEDGTELKTEQERQARFVELVKKYWAEGLTTHGIYGKEIDPQTSQAKIMPMSDLDGSACLFLLKEAGIDIGKSRINYVQPGKGAETGLVMDTSDQLGVIAENRGKRLIVDHHQEGGRETSAAKMLYELLSNPEIGLLKREPWLENFVEFVAHEDNKNYSDAEAEELLKNYGRNFVSLSDNLGFEEMKKFFQDGTYTVFQALPDEYLKKFKFTFAPLRHQDKRVKAGEVVARKSGYKEASLAAIKELEAGGLVLDTGEERFGRVLIDTGQQNEKGEWKKRVGLDFDAVRPSGYGAYLVWLPEKEQFFLKTVKKIDFELPDGYNVRGHYLLKSNTAGALRVGLRDILAKLAGDDNFEMPDELKAALESPKGKQAAPATVPLSVAAATPEPGLAPVAPVELAPISADKAETIEEKLEAKLQDLKSRYESGSFPIELIEDDDVKKLPPAERLAALTVFEEVIAEGQQQYGDQVLRDRFPQGLAMAISTGMPRKDKLPAIASPRSKNYVEEKFKTLVGNHFTENYLRDNLLEKLNKQIGIKIELKWSHLSFGEALIAINQLKIALSQLDNASLVALLSKGIYLGEKNEFTPDGPAEIDAKQTTDQMLEVLQEQINKVQAAAPAEPLFRITPLSAAEAALAAAPAETKPAITAEPTKAAATPEQGAAPVIDLERVKEEKRKEVKGQIAQLLHETAGAMADGDQKKIRVLYEQYKLLKKELEE